MIRNEMQLKSKITLKNPALFVEVKTKNEAKLIREAVSRYPVNKAHDGLNQIDGLSIPIGNYHQIASFLGADLKSAFDENHYSLDKRIRLIDPSLYFLFMGKAQDKKNCCELIKQWAPKIPPIVQSIADSRLPREKTDRVIRELYPLLDVVLIRNLLQFQIEKHASILINPSVPLSSRRMVNHQVEKTREMNRTGRILFDTLLTRFNTERDLMNLVTLSPSILTADNVDNIMDAVMQGTPDIIGVRLMNLNEKPEEVRNLLKFIKSLSSSGKPVIVFNVREFGYVTFCHGATAISTPIATSAYTTMGKRGEPPKRLGSYYHCIDMVDYSHENLPDKIRSENYKLPCHCEICNGFSSFLDIEKKRWNIVRKVHFLLVKNMEMQELRKTDVPFEIALADKFGRSLRTGYVPFLT